MSNFISRSALPKVYKTPSPDSSKEKERESFLLKELDLVESEIKRLRAEGPLRIQFLFTTTSALLGSLLVLAGLKSVDPEWVRRAGIATSFLLFTFAQVTFQYLIGRDISCDRNARATARIRRYFLDRSPSLQLHVSWQTSDAPTQWIRVDNSGIRWMNLLIASGVGSLCAGLVIFEVTQNYWVSYACGVVSAIFIVGAMRYWARARLEGANKKALAEQRFPANS